MNATDYNEKQEGNQILDDLNTIHFSSDACSKLDTYINEFRETGFVKLPTLLNASDYQLLFDESVELLENHSKRKDFAMAETDFTLRKISTVSGNVISKTAKLIPGFYQNTELVNFLSSIAEIDLFLTPDPADRHTVHRLHNKGDEHGGHVDTYPYVLVFLLEHPRFDEGGELKFVPNSLEIKDLDTDKALVATFNDGDCYFMKAGSNVHSVLPLKKDCHRTVLVFTYADEVSTEILTSYSSDKLYD